MTESQYAIMNTHSWVSGMCVVNPEDLACGEFDGVTVECSHCEDTYPSRRPCPNAHAVTLELWGFTSES
jgi:hypothetical protein